MLARDVRRGVPTSREQVLHGSGQLSLPLVVPERQPSGSVPGRPHPVEERQRCPVRRSPNGHEILGWPEARADPRSGTQRLVSYLVRSTPSGNVRVSTKFRFTQLSRAAKNGVPPPTRTGAVTSTYSSISPARMAAAARVAPPMSMGPPSPALSRVISVAASPVTRRVFQSTVLVVEENTTFGMSR